MLYVMPLAISLQVDIIKRVMGLYLKSGRGGGGQTGVGEALVAMSELRSLHLAGYRAGAPDRWLAVVPMTPAFGGWHPEEGLSSRIGGFEGIGAINTSTS